MIRLIKSTELQFLNNAHENLSNFIRAVSVRALEKLPDNATDEGIREAAQLKDLLILAHGANNEIYQLLKREYGHE